MGRHLIQRIAIGVGLLVAAHGNASGQSHYDANMAVGVRAGADISRNFFNPSVKQLMKPGGLAGVTFRYVEENHFGLIAELNFIQRGWQENFEESPYVYKRTINYLQLPVLAHIYFGGRGRFFINAGPLVGLRLGDSVDCNFDTSATSDLPDFPKWHNIYQYDEPITQKVDYGICGGLGGEFNITKRNSLSLEARFYYGLGNLFGSSRKDRFNASNSMAVEFALGYWFRFK
ncbi:MAG: PorT family protein [Bacteroides sp.]|nr:PorT family protein [Bacteroides sp.]